MISRTQYKQKAGQFQKKKLSKELLNSVFSSKQVQRKFPIQAALHIVLDGALLGILITVAIMSSVALHSQYLWTKSFTKLETTRDLNRRTLESTSILESYLLRNQKLSRNLVPTKAEDLIYVDRPKPEETKKSFDVTLKSRLLEKISSFPVKSGY
ncbi:conserved hypothetical protein [Prochlorococcus marinus str. NATL2A]|uniref:Uncharacterized protein n=1 Tax=Prochlorococcus marinus (strain NATL2A) TaxID=59920 RepID=Q46GQ9_PROMT|nr:hypothetical protein [Prochlorococcus marinus]AAZ59337.1 conserved hypothetical protein [Prochlorococcus marinus str. NATL2A]